MSLSTIMAKHGGKKTSKPAQEKDVSEPAPAPQPTEATDTVRMPIEFASRVKRIVGVVIAKTGKRFGAADVFEVNRESFEAWLAQVEAWAEGLE